MPCWTPSEAMTVHRLPRGEHIAPMPEPRRARGRDRVLPGGLPPQPNRTSYARWQGATRTACEPYVSRACRAEVTSTRRWLA